LGAVVLEKGGAEERVAPKYNSDLKLG